MNSLFKYLSTAPARLFSLKQLISRSDQLVLLPFYHTVHPLPLPHISQLYRHKSLKEFEKDLDFLLTNFKPISANHLHQIRLGESSIKQASFFLSFDDGLQEIYSLIAPILYKKGIQATFFINPDFVDNKLLFFRYKLSLILDSLQKKSLSSVEQKAIQEISSSEPINLRYQQIDKINQIAQVLDIDFNDYLKKQQPYLNHQQIKSLVKQGFHIGGHSLDHPLYKDIDLKQQIRQTLDSVDYVQTNFQQDLRLFAFPFTDDGVSKHFFEAMRGKLDLSFGTAGIKKQSYPWHFQRLPMEDIGLSAEQHIKNNYAAYLVKKLVSKNIVQYP